MRIFLVVVMMFVIYQIGVSDGYDNGHVTVAKECNTTGSFYVGNQVFSCKLR